MKLRAHGITHRGLVRPTNQDALLLDDKCHAYAVADGVGGQPGGDRASEAAVAAVEGELATAGCGVLQDLPRVVDQAHHAVRAAGRPFGPSGVATTLTLAHFRDDVVRVAHVGDSCALLVREGRLIALTRKHNVENERPDLFTLAPYSDAFRQALTRTLGQDGALPVDISTSLLRAGDRVVLATDGITDVITPEEIARASVASLEPSAIATDLVQLGLHRGGQDNLTVVVVLVDTV